MAAEPGSERADDDMNKDSVKKDKKKKKKKNKEEETETKGQEQLSDPTTVENSAAERDEVEGKQSTNSKKSKRKRAEDSAGDQAVIGEGNKKRKKEHPDKQQTLDTAVENLATRFDEAEEGEQSGKSKKSKSMSDDAGEASAVTRNDKKRKKGHPAVLEKSSQPKNTSEGENGEVKERGKDGKKPSLKSSESASVDVDGKNDKKKKKSKEGTAREGIEEKEMAARPKSKGKRVSFADSAEVFETQGGGDEGLTQGGKNNNKKKAARAQSMNKGKRVSFADSAEVFETKGGERGSSDESNIVHGVRFTKAEDATLMEAIHDFIEMKQLGEKGLDMFRTSRKHKELLHCWDVIGKSLPHRPHKAIYKRSRILLHRSDVRGCTNTEKDYIRSFVKENGTDWKKLSLELGKCDIHVKDTWRRMKSENLTKGSWTQDEHQKLFDLVNLDLRMKAHQLKNPDNRKLRDNISWEAISDKLSTRNHKNCCIKWYNTLASPLVRKGVWADLDDYLLVQALQKDDAIVIEDVDWDSLLDHRSGEVCRQRWNQMVRGLGGHREKPFIDQVDVLSRRYCPEMIEYRKDSSEETPANGDKKNKKSKESKEPGSASAEVEKKKKKKNKKSKESEEPGAANGEVEKEKNNKKKKSKESEEPCAANAEVKKKKKKKKTDTQHDEVVAMEAESGKKDKKKKIKQADQ